MSLAAHRRPQNGQSNAKSKNRHQNQLYPGSAIDPQSTNGHLQQKSSAEIRLEQARLKISVLENDLKASSSRNGRRGRLVEDLRDQVGQLKEENERRRKQLQILARQSHFNSNNKNHLQGLSKGSGSNGGGGKSAFLVDKQNAKTSRRLDSLRFERRKSHDALQSYTKELELVKKQLQMATPRFKSLGIPMPLKLLKKSSTAKLESQIEYEKMKNNELQNVLKTYKTLLETLSKDLSGLRNSIEDREKECLRLDSENAKMDSVHCEAEKSRTISKFDLNNLETSIATRKAKKETAIAKLKSDLDSRKNYNEILEKRQLLKQSLYSPRTKDTSQASQSNSASPAYGMIQQDKNGVNSQNNNNNSLDSAANHMAAYHAMLEISKNATGMPDLACLISSYENQDSLGRLLKETLDGKQQELARLAETLSALEKEREDKKFTGKLLKSAGRCSPVKSGATGAKVGCAGPSDALIKQMTKDMVQKSIQLKESKGVLNRKARRCSEAKKSIQNLISLISLAESYTTANSNSINELDEQQQHDNISSSKFSRQNSTNHTLNASRIHSAGTRESLLRDVQLLQQKCSQVASAHIKNSNSDKGPSDFRACLKQFMADCHNNDAGAGPNQSAGGSMKNEDLALVEQLDLEHGDWVSTSQPEWADEALQDGQEDLLQYVHGSRVLSRSQIKQKNGILAGSSTNRHHHQFLGGQANNNTNNNNNGGRRAQKM